MKRYTGSEKIIVENNESNIYVKDFWSWAYSDLHNTVKRGKFGEFIVSTATGAENANDMTDITFNAFDLLYKNKYRIEVKTSSLIQSWDLTDYRKSIPSLNIAKASLPDENGDYKDGAPKQRNSDIYVFCVYKAETREQSPLNMDLWDFYVIPTKTIDDKLGDQKSIRLTSLIQLPVIKCNYSEIKEAIDRSLGV